MKDAKQAVLLGIDVTTTEMALAVSDGRGGEDYASTPMRGATTWRGDPAFPAFDLAAVPEMLRELLDSLQAKAWDFGGDSKSQRYVSIACRQHDQVVLGKDGCPLLPAISWQCNAATSEVEALRGMGVEKTVGKIEPRLVLPKLKRVLNQDASLAAKIATVFMTGDWIACQLTGVKTLSTSDALSNGLLRQLDRKRADDVIRQAGFPVEWFPDVVQSGEVVGVVQPPSGPRADPWRPLRETLEGWRFVAGLGDNHASAVGCGMKDDHKRMVISAGTSGTINLSCPRSANLPQDGRSMRFEFYEPAVLLLMMLGDCGSWHQRFVNDCAPGYQGRLDQLNLLALGADLSGLRRTPHCDGSRRETRPPQWANMDLGQQAASTQFSIVLELLLRAKQMLEEVRDAQTPAVEEYVLTGGLSRSLFFQHVFHAGVELLAPQASVKISGREGPLRYKTSAYGALINAELPSVGGGLTAIHADPRRFPLADCAAADPAAREQLQRLLRSCGL